MKCTVFLFAVARERVGASSVELDLPDGSTVLDLKEALGRDFPPLSALMPMVRLAVDGAYATDDQAVLPGAELAIIPPVSGGGWSVE